jgi:diaminopimelate epimerase
VIFVDDVSRVELERVGPALESHPRFPKRTNVEFVQVLNEREIRVHVWERGAGVTLACGTGACASAVASLAAGKVRGEVAVHLPGGTLKISWAGGTSPVMMEGPAEEVFRGEYSGKGS